MEPQNVRRTRADPCLHFTDEKGKAEDPTVREWLPHIPAEGDGELQGLKGKPHQPECHSQEHP